jgi:hypothetical protein
MRPFAVLGFFSLILFMPHAAHAAEITTTPAAMQGVWIRPLFHSFRQARRFHRPHGFVAQG